MIYLCKLREEQKSILDKFKCERLTANIKNKELIKSFENKRGSTLVEYLKKTAWENDSSGETAYYVIKNEDDEIVMYFSLKCGSLYNPLIDTEEVQRKISLFRELNTLLEEKNFFELRNRMKENHIAIEDLAKMPDFINEKKKIKSYIKKDSKLEDDEKINRVAVTFSGIELVQFCANDNYKDKWKLYKFNHSIGKTMFWYLVVPIIIEISKLVGCKYLFLFAADLSENRTLENYYEMDLLFKQLDDVSVMKPLYDFGCLSMCQEIKGLSESREEFLNNFNDENYTFNKLL